MERRIVEIFTGKVFKVPSHIVRLDHEATHGWQVRYGKPWKMFSDHTNDGSGARRSLAEAIDELAKRVKRLPAPTGLRTAVSVNKTSGLPVGISGPKLRQREGKGTAYCEFQVTFPVVGSKSKNTHVYIGTQNTVTKEKVEAALAKAIALRNKHVKKYQQASNQAIRLRAAALGVVRAA